MFEFGRYWRLSVVFVQDGRLEPSSSCAAFLLRFCDLLFRESDARTIAARGIPPTLERTYRTGDVFLRSRMKYDLDRKAARRLHPKLDSCFVDTVLARTP